MHVYVCLYFKCVYVCLHFIYVYVCSHLYTCLWLIFHVCASVKTQSDSPSPVMRAAGEIGRRQHTQAYTNTHTHTHTPVQQQLGLEQRATQHASGNPKP
jgi:hypothetical protein